jgi:hypothetical protein
MARSTAVVVGLLAVAPMGGCRSEPPVYEPDLSPIKSGDRLRARWVSNPSGDVRYFEGWYDTELGVACEWRAVGEGYRCLPAADTIVYRDAGCTEPAAVEYSCEPTAYVAAPLDGSDCAPASQPAPDKFFEIGGVIDAAATEHWQRSGDDCVQVPQEGPITLRAVGSEVPMSTFAAAELRRDYSGTRLAVDFLRGEDGSQEQFVTYDLELETPCTPDYIRADGVCLPPSNVYLISDGGGYYAGSDCAGDLLAYSTSCEPTGFVYEYVQDGACGWTSRYYERGEPWTMPVSAGPVDVCVEVTDTPYTFFTVGDEISDDQFLTLGTTTYGEGRLRLTVPSYQGELDVSVPRNPALFDTTLDVKCTISPMSDGSFRCMPAESSTSTSDLSASVLWADPTCTEDPLFSWVKNDACTPTPTWVIESEYLSCGGGVLGVYARGAEHTGEVYSKQGVDCVLTTPDPSSRVYGLSDPLPFTDFAELEHVVE